MRALMAGLMMVGAWAAVVAPVSAGWDNVFQPTLFGRHRQPTTAKYYVAPVVVQSSPVVVAQYAPPVVAQSAPCDPCQQQKCTTQYIQRSYYQPVTTMETRTEMVPVTTYRSSYYYEPVTSYRYSAYYDPCTCATTQVAVPSVSYQLREQKCPVQSWVSRCVQVPVQGYQKVDYWQPQTTCCNTTLGAPIMNGQPPPQVAPPPQPQPQPPPQISPSYSPPPEGPPSISGSKTPGTGASKSPMWDSYYPPMQPNMPEARTSTPNASWQPQLGNPVPIQTNRPPVQPQPQPAAPPVKFDRIAVGPDSQVEGQVVRSDNSPKASAKILFVNAATGQRQTIYANTAGRFQTQLATGSWLVYLHGANDIATYHSRIDVNGSQARQVNLVSRSN
jgi:hypothetical protein